MSALEFKSALTWASKTGMTSYQLILKEAENGEVESGPTIKADPVC
jgi:hypothetical protein